MGAKLVRFQVVRFPKTRVLGKSVIHKVDVGIDDRTIQDLWESMAHDGSLDFLLHLPGRVGQDDDTVGWMGDFEPGADHYTYLAGILVEPTAPVPEGYIYRDIADCDMAIGWIQEMEGEEGGDLHANASEHVTRAMKEHGYEYDSSNGLFEMEYISYERHRLARERGEEAILDFYSPCKRAANETIS